MDVKKTNIIYILADDMGYGDMGCNNDDCKPPTPTLDRLAAGGMRFTDAHAGSSVCTPSRYGILTGRYAWRSRLKNGIVWEWDGALIEPERLTVAEMLRQNNYRTACIGKWHLGWDWATVDGRHPNDTLSFGKMRGRDNDRADFGRTRIDFSKPIGGGPVDRGFDSYFGVDVPNFPPYAWFENNRLVDIPTEEKPADMYGHPGLACPGWQLEAMIPEFTRRAEVFISEQGAAQTKGEGNPFFLYLALTSPHSPIVPNPSFCGKSGIGPYGDFVCEVDWAVGKVTAALENAGIRDNTLVVFTSDNGPEDRVPDDEGVYERARRSHHYSMWQLRGIKRDVWEGGHRVPFIASWPAIIPAGRCCDQLISLTDLMATCANISGQDLPADAGEDSISMLPLLRGQTDRPTREYAVHHSASGKFAVRNGEWVLIDAPDGSDNNEPEWFKKERDYTAHDCPAELFHLGEDLSERYNRYREQQGIVQKLMGVLQQAKSVGCTTSELPPDARLTE